MRREDWLWLLLKGAGVYLVVVGIEGVPELLLAIHEGPGSEDTTRLGPFLRVAVPIAGGTLLLLHRFAATRTPAEPVATPTATIGAPALSRGDWLWVGFKLLGVYAVLLGLLQLPFLLVSADRFTPGVVLGVAHSAVSLGLGVWLVLGTRAWRWACRGEPTRREPRGSEPARG